MVIDIKMCRFENVPWGFRLVGGSDFEYPLTVVKVTEGSIAEEAGLCAGDVIVRINETPTSPLTHEQVNQIIRHCGNVFFLGVYRSEEEDDDASSSSKQFPIIGPEEGTTPDSFLDIGSSCKSPSSVAYSEEQNYMPELIDRPCSVLSDNSERKLVEEEIAAVLSGETDVLKDRNVTEVKPKSGVFLNSEVRRHLKEELTKTKEEREKENRKWTTFLQKPNRPIPKSKAEIEAEKRHAANAYRVHIVKSVPKPQAPPVVKEPTPPIEILITPEIEPEPEPVPEPEAPAVVEEQRVEIPTPTDSEVPSLEDVPEEKIERLIQDESEARDAKMEEENREESPIKSIEEQESNEQIEAKDTAINTNGEEKLEKLENQNGKETSISEVVKPIVAEKTGDELALERQLADVQRQLIALSSLPSTIQSTLDAVTRQLAELLPAFKLQQIQIPNSESHPLQLERIEEQTEQGGREEKQQDVDKGKEGETLENGIDVTENPKDLETSEELSSTMNGDNKPETLNETEENDEEIKDKDQVQNIIELQRQVENNKQMKGPQTTEDQQLKKQKRHDVIEELEEHLDRQKNRKRSKRAFGPLTPSSERPVVLPGGRRWYRPKDAYNDEFIAETLSSQAELITGTTLGSGFESTNLGYDPREYHSIGVSKQIETERVNFMKYQKPDKKVDLNRSEVYKVIHHLDRQPGTGIEIRAPIVAAEADIMRAAQS